MIDASAVVTMLAGGRGGRWVAAEVDGVRLFAPAVMPFEAANGLRRLGNAGDLDRTALGAAHTDLLALTRNCRLVDYDVLAPLAWAHRENLTVHDATYAALADLLDAPLVTLDRAFATVPNRRFEVLSPP